MADNILHKTQSGIAGEFFAAGELARRGFNVTLTFGNTKAIDLLIEKEGKLFPVQVKTIQRRKSICWNISLSKIEGNHFCYILVNLNVDTLASPEFYILPRKKCGQILNLQNRVVTILTTLC